MLQTTSGALELSLSIISGLLHRPSSQDMRGRRMCKTGNAGAVNNTEGLPLPCRDVQRLVKEVDQDQLAAVKVQAGNSHVRAAVQVPPALAEAVSVGWEESPHVPAKLDPVSDVHLALVNKRPVGSTAQPDVVCLVSVVEAGAGWTVRKAFIMHA